MPKHATSTSFKPGQSGNPGGRPKTDIDLRELFRKDTATAHAILLDMAKNADTHAVRVRAAEVLLDRAWGKAEAHSKIDMNFNQSFSDALISLGIREAKDGPEDVAGGPDSVH